MKFDLISAAFVADPATRLETNGDGELIPQRRERYVFRPALIKVLASSKILEKNYELLVAGRVLRAYAFSESQSSQWDRERLQQHAEKGEER